MKKKQSEVVLEFRLEPDKPKAVKGNKVPKLKAPPVKVRPYVPPPEPVGVKLAGGEYGFVFLAGISTAFKPVEVGAVVRLPAYRAVGGMREDGTFKVCRDKVDYNAWLAATARLNGRGL